MSAWTLTEPVSGVTVELVPTAGDITVTEDRTTAVHYALRGSSPWVSDGPARVATITVPELVFDTLGGFEQLRALRNVSRRCVLLDDTGRSWPVRFVGPLTSRVRDTADRADRPLTYVTLSLVGVA